ncbi:hypothetical protein C8Q80DRAFT_1119407 [Daedaleopsis nitida]|nr:hypothetical protein C8Q80DRAFT_1119407 [Daedaleopsis nitida]
MSRTLCTECVTVTHPRAWEGLENRQCTLCNNSAGPQKQMAVFVYNPLYSVHYNRSVHGNPGYAPVLLLHYLQYCTMCNQYAGYPPDVAPNTSPNEAQRSLRYTHTILIPPLRTVYAISHSTNYQISSLFLLYTAVTRPSPDHPYLFLSEVVWKLQLQALVFDKGGNWTVVNSGMIIIPTKFEGGWGRRIAWV